VPSRPDYAHRLDRQAQSPADDGRDVAHRVALVGHGVPGGPGRRQFQGQPEEDGRVERVHGRPALGAVARVAGHAVAPRRVRQQAGEPALALVVHGARHPHRRGAHAARGQCEERVDRARPAGDRSLEGQRVLLGGGAARHPWRSGDGGDRAVAVGQLLPQRGQGGALLGDGGREPLGGVVAGTEGEAHHAVGLRGAGPQDVEVGQATAQHLGAGALEGLLGAVRPGQRENGVAVGEQFGDDGGTDRAGTAGDKDVHEALLK